MDRKEWHDLEGLFTALAKDAALIQERLDEAHAEAQEAFAHVLARLPASERASLLRLAPDRLVVGKHEVACSVRVATARSLKLELAVKPIALGVAVLFERSESQEMKVSVEVEAVPVRMSNPQAV